MIEYPDFELHCADSLAFLKTVRSGECDSVVTDPPYHLTQASRGGSPRTNAPETPFGRTRLGSKGFMGKTWDGGDIAFQVEFWREVWRVLKPGGFVLAFGGTRTYHRLACAIEDAGFEPRDVICWHYGSGMPKSHDVSKNIDKQAGAEREVVGKYALPNGKEWNLAQDSEEDVYVQPGTFTSSGRRTLDVTAPSTVAAAAWSGWGTALKPATELVCVARKPIEGTVVNNVLTHGTGAINIDGCRVEYEAGGNVARNPSLRGSVKGGNGGHIFACEAESREMVPSPLGRWPANLLHDGSDEVLAAFPDAPGQLAKAKTDGTPQNNGVYGALNYTREAPEPRLEIDKSAARFFYSAKVSKKERGEGNDHPCLKPVALCRWLTRLVTPPGGVVLDPFCGSGSMGIAAVQEGFYYVGLDLDPHYIDIAHRRILNWCPQEEERAA